MFDQEFEEDVLATILRKEDYLKRAARICSSHHFGTKEHSWLWTTAESVWTKYRERATLKLVIARAKREFPDPEKRKPYVILARKLYKRKVVSPSAALDQLEKFVREVNLQKSLEESAVALAKGDIDEAEGIVQKASRNTVRTRDYTLIHWSEEFEERQAQRKHEKEHPEEGKIIPTGLKKLDKILSGGGRAGELGLIMGTTGRGKSVGLTNICWAGAMRRFNCVYFALEMPARQIAARQDARAFQVDYNKFKTYDFTPADLRALKVQLKRIARVADGRVKIVSMPVRSASILSLRGALDDLMDDHGFRADLILVDSGDHLKSTDRTLDSFRLQQADVYWQLKALAEEEGYMIWSSTHAGKEWAHQTATAEAAGESYDKSRIADIVFSINDPNSKPTSRKTEIEDEDEDDEEAEEIAGPGSAGSLRKLEGYLAKYRDGASLIKIDLEADFSKMIFKTAKEEEPEA